jgi:hypothetical protein
LCRDIPSIVLSVQLDHHPFFDMLPRKVVIRRWFTIGSIGFTNGYSCSIASGLNPDLPDSYLTPSISQSPGLPVSPIISSVVPDRNLSYPRDGNGEFDWWPLKILSVDREPSALRLHIGNKSGYGGRKQGSRAKLLLDRNIPASAKSAQIST